MCVRERERKREREREGGREREREDEKDFDLHLRKILQPYNLGLVTTIKELGFSQGHKVF